MYFFGRDMIIFYEIVGFFIGVRYNYVGFFVKQLYSSLI